MNPYNNSWQSRLNTIEGVYNRANILSDWDRLEKMDIKLIEKFLRTKKIKNINGSNEK